MAGISLGYLVGPAATDLLDRSDPSLAPVVAILGLLGCLALRGRRTARSRCRAAVMSASSTSTW